MVKEESPSKSPAQRVSFCEKKNRIRRLGTSFSLYGNAAANPEGCQAERCGKQQNDTQEYNSTFFLHSAPIFSDVYAADDVHYLKQLKNRNYQFLSYGIMIAIIR